MPPRALFRQADFLYDEKWTAEVDKLFIEQLHAEEIRGHFRVGANNSLTIEQLQWIINNQLNKDFSFEECRQKVRKLQKRYRVFDWLVHLTGVSYNPYTNIITGAPFVWDHICKEQPFAYAYMTYGDPNWRELQVIFGDDGLGDVQNYYINISSDDEEQEEPPVHAPFQPMVEETVINISTESDNSNSFWREMVPYVSDSASDGYVEFEEALIHFPTPTYDAPASPMHYNNGEDSIASSSSASNSPENFD